MTTQFSEFMSLLVPWLAELAWKSSLLLLGALAVGFLLQKRWPLAISTMWNATLAALVLLPVTMLVPAWQIDLWPDRPAVARVDIGGNKPQAVDQVLPQFSNANGEGTPELPASNSLTIEPLVMSPEVPGQRPGEIFTIGHANALLACILVAGILWSFWRWFSDLRALQRMIRSAEQVVEQDWVMGLSHWLQELQISRSVRLLHSSEARIPFTCGVLSPVIMLPGDLPPRATRSERDVILLHELTHIARNDCAWQSLLRLAQVIYWWQPLLWLAGRQIGKVRESACDRFALSRLESRQQYIDVLLRMAERIVQPLDLGVGLAIVRASRLTSRLHDISGGKILRRFRTRGPWSLALWAGCLAVVFGIGAGVTELRSAQSSGAKVDIHGDDLPPGAIARLGTNRLQHGGAVLSLRFSADGSQLFTRSGGRLFLWDSANGKLRRQADLRGLFMLWGRDSQLLMAKSESEVLLPWNLNQAAGPPLEPILPNEGVVDRAFIPAEVNDQEHLTHFTSSPAGQLLATATAGQQDIPRRIQVRRVEPNKPIAEWEMMPHEWVSPTAVQQLIISGDGRRLLVLANDLGGETLPVPPPQPNAPEKFFRITVCDLEKGTQSEPVRLPEPASFNSKALAISPSGDRIALGQRNKEILILQPGSLQPEMTLFVPQTDEKATSPASVLEFSPDGHLLAGSGRDGKIWLWDLRTGNLLRELKGHRLVVEKLAFSPDGRTLASGGQDGRVLRWNVPTGENLDREVAHGFRVLGVSLSRDGSLAATAGMDSRLRIWNRATGELVKAIAYPEKANPIDCVFSPTEDVLAVMEIEYTGNTASGKIVLLEAASGRRLWEKKAVPHRDVHRVLSFSADGRCLVARTAPDCVTIWDAKSGDSTAEFTVRENTVVRGTLPPPEAPPANRDEVRKITAVTLSPDHTRLAITTSSNYGGSGRLEIVDVETAAQLHSIELQKSTSSQVRFSPDGRTLVTAGHSTLRGWRVPDSLDMHSPGLEDSLILWDAGTGTVIRKLGVEGIQEGGYRDVHDVAFSPDARHLVTAERSGNVLIYDVASGKQLRVLQGHLGEVMALGLSADGKTLVSGSIDNTGLVWDFAFLTAPQVP